MNSRTWDKMTNKINEDQPILVSIVVPSYNAGQFLSKTIDSILSQDYRPIECILVDDGSTDSSIEELGEKGNHITIVRQANNGQASALNHGFSLCRGEYIGYLSADDLIDKDCVSNLIDELLKVRDRSKPIIIFPKYRTIDTEGRTLNPDVIRFHGVSQMIKNFQCAVGPGALFDRKLFDELGGWNSSYSQIPDYVFWLKLAAAADFQQVPKVLASFRVHEQSQTFAQSSFSKADESVRLALEMEALGDSIPEQDKRAFASSAFLFSACLHIRAGRYWIGFVRWLQSLKLKPQRATGIGAMRMLGASAYASLFYFTKKNKHYSDTNCYA